MAGRLGWLVLALATSGCPSPIAGPTTGPKSEAPEAFGAHATCSVSKDEMRAAGATDAHLAKIGRSPYRFFRALAPQFEARVCHEFEDVRWRLPTVAIHGDAHVEQFVVTQGSYGLEDFDRSGYGAAVVDLVRYATSLRLACTELGCARPDDVVAAFFAAYRSSLEAPPVSSEPAVVSRLRTQAPQTREAWLAWADSLMQPLDEGRAASAARDWRAFQVVLRELFPGRGPEEFDLVRVGSLTMGVGSALEDKVLFRARGATDAPSDDVMFEARQGDPPEAAPASCIWRGTHGDPLVLMFMAILGRRMPDTYGFLPIKGPTSRDYWVQAWDPGYQELSVKDLRTEAELTEVAVDAARQLAGHFWLKFPEPLRPHQRRAQLAAFDLTRDRAASLAVTLERETLEGFAQYNASP